ncbi:hypothetical protein BST27_14450 [Mycobacterium intermedium]|uniref:Lipoprotein LppJ n=1 Tax=Mycobacterium intermedium TaxID=28445 RepID=A0A1E3SK48_MYCIE|nr:hypothetical protein BHQ20_06705 [Mycobacterium intermedium]OPE51019.1 hypothetical protein BV508_08140 [Mycobacterium intermedium]ORB04217.1 hypothetical protein BST27_14450 [Mycobacterium intermedium]
MWAGELRTQDDRLDHPANPVSDEQSRTEVVEAGRQIVGAAGLRTTNAGYQLMSCKNRDEPPYQGAIYLTFALPTGVRAEEYLPKVKTALVAHGWTEGMAADDDRLAKLTRDSVTAILQPDRDDTSMGVLRLYGQCRNVNDHRMDATTWINITGQLG